MTTALVLSAGGMFAAWEAGVWKALCGRFRPDLIVGTSAGAWNGWVIASGGSAEDLAVHWLDPRTADILKPGLHRFGVLTPKTLHAKARELHAEYRPQIPFGLTMVEVPRLRPQLVRDPEIIWEHLAATASIPLCFPPVTIGGTRYVDGGLLGALPLWAASLMGATRAIAVNALTTLPFRMLRKVIQPPAPPPGMEIVLIEPSVPLGSLRDATVWKESNVRKWMELGERDGNQAATSFTM